MFYLPDGLQKAIFVLVALVASIVLNYLVRFIAYRSVKVIPHNTKKYYRALTAAKLVISTTKYLIFFVFIIAMLIIVGVDVKTIVTGIGFFSIALGFGAKSLVEDCIAGLFIFFEEQYDVGDTIKIDDFKGEVISLGFKSTTLRNWLGAIYTIGNGKIQCVINYSQANAVAVVKLKVDNSTDINKLEQLSINQLSYVKDKFEIFVEDPVFNGVTQANSTGIEVMYTSYTKPMCNIEGERVLRKEILLFFKNNGIILSTPKVEFRGESNV